MTRYKPRAQSPEPRAGATAYVTALTLLSRRELSERQIRDRLRRRGYDGDSIDDAVASLKTEGALDDARVAGAIARTETGLKHRGRVRVRLAMQRAGISGDVADRAIDDTFADLDGEALLESALGRRLKGDQPIADDREFQRLYRYLIGQGFESDRVLKLLAARRNRR